MTPSTPDLLTHLAQLTQCSYLSDLRSITSPSVTLWLALNRTSTDLFSTQAWQEALCYLTEVDAWQLDGATCRQRLLDHYCP